MNEVLKNRKKLSELSPEYIKSLVYQYNIDKKIENKSPFKLDPSLRTNIVKK